MPLLELGMRKHPVRKIITDAIWSKLEVALAAAKHSAAGAPGEMTDREFLEALLHLQRTDCPWRDLPPALGYWHAVTCAFGAGRPAESGCGSGKSPGRALRRGAWRAPGLDDGARSSARRRRAKKNGPDQALGRSRGGWSTKLHAATLDENCAVALHLSAGHAHDGRQLEALYESLDPDNVLEFAALDKGYDADRIRARLALDGIEAVIPPISSRCVKLPYDVPSARPSAK